MDNEKHNTPILDEADEDGPECPACSDVTDDSPHNCGCHRRKPCN